MTTYEVVVRTVQISRHGWAAMVNMGPHTDTVYALTRKRATAKAHKIIAAERERLAWADAATVTRHPMR